MDEVCAVRTLFNRAGLRGKPGYYRFLSAALF
jgi:hypothetical protein